MCQRLRCNVAKVWLQICFWEWCLCVFLLCMALNSHFSLLLVSHGPNLFLHLFQIEAYGEPTSDTHLRNCQKFGNFYSKSGPTFISTSCKSIPTQRLLSEGLIIWFWRFCILVKSKKGSVPRCVQLVTLNWVSHGSTQWIIVAESWHLWWALICIQIKCQERNQIIETLSIKHSC